MDRFRFAGILKTYIKCWFTYPYCQSVRIRAGHVRADCARMNDEQLSLLLGWAFKQIARPLSAEKRKLFDEIGEEYVRREFNNALHRTMYVPVGVDMPEMTAA